MIKLVSSSDFNFDDASSRLIKHFSRGVDLGNFTKTASSDSIREAIKKIAFDKDYTYVHVLAVGDTETTGPNRNADGFSGHWNKTAKDHFLSGHLFKHHKNTDPELAVGKVALAEYNPDMGRIELVVGLNNTKCAEEVNKLSKGEDIAVSMGAKVAYDVCSICDKHSKSPAEYCDHMKKMAGKVLEDGRQVYVDNPDPRYFDISIVHRPADRCAFSFRKVANANESVQSSVELAKLAGLVDHSRLSSYSLQVYQTIRKLAAMEKEIEGMIDAGKSDELSGLIPKSDDATTKSITIISSNKEDPKNVIDGLADSESVLGLKDFLKMITGKKFDEVEGEIPRIESHLPGIFSKMEKDPCGTDMVESMCEGKKACLAISSHDAINRLKTACSMTEDAVRSRITIALISPVRVSNIKQAAIKDSSKPIESIAQLYATYKLATVLKNSDRPLLMKSVVASNYIKL